MEAVEACNSAMSTQDLRMSEEVAAAECKQANHPHRFHKPAYPGYISDSSTRHSDMKPVAEVEAPMGAAVAAEAEAAEAAVCRYRG